MENVQQQKRLQEECPDCSVHIGQPHERGCDVERCSVCQLQKLRCNCASHDPQASYWTGEWPGTVECRKRGWWTEQTDAGWQPCGKETPGATEDLNRLAFFEQDGYDGLYPNAL